MPVVKYVLNHYEKMQNFYDFVWIVYPCSPFVLPKDILIANNLFIKNKFKNPLIAISEYSYPTEWVYRKDSNNIITPDHPGKFLKRSQDFKKAYFDAGVFSLYTRNQLLKTNDEGTDQGFIGYVMPKIRVVDIDTLDDWIYSETISKLIY